MTWNDGPEREDRRRPKRGRVPSARPLAAVLVVSLGTGCYSTWDVPHGELRKLDAYRPPKVVTLQDDTGEEVEFDRHASFVVPDARGRPKHFHVESAKVLDGTFFAYHPKQGLLRIPLERDRTVTIKKYETGSTGLAIGAASVGGAVFAILMIYVYSSALGI